MKKNSTRSSAPKKLQAIQTSRHFRVTHHRHTGHITPHRTTSYPVLAMIVLIVGVLMYGWTGMVNAVEYGPAGGEYSVHTRVVGTPPTKVPTITRPNNGTNFTESPITVYGTCQLETYVTLYRNGVASGVANCMNDATYSIKTDLFVGANRLQVRIFSPTDEAGPFSDIRTVYYNPLHPDTTDPDIRDPLMLKSLFRYQGYYTGVAAPVDLSISGGTPPYAISVDWGDDQRELVSKASIGDFSLEHTYRQAGKYRGTYVVTVTAIDTRKASTTLQVLSIINNPNGTTSTTGSIGGSTDGRPYDAFLKYAWSGYGAAILMLISFWLGERREYHQLHKRHRKYA